ncbi:MAG: hypothetical protein SangKO_075400 [Sandaracinaceae bacterium]
MDGSHRPPTLPWPLDREGQRETRNPFATENLGHESLTASEALSGLGLTQPLIRDELREPFASGHAPAMTHVLTKINTNVLTAPITFVMDGGRRDRAGAVPGPPRRTPRGGGGRARRLAEGRRQAPGHQPGAGLEDLRGEREPGLGTIGKAVERLGISWDYFTDKSLETPHWRNFRGDETAAESSPEPPFWSDFISEYDRIDELDPADLETMRRFAVKGRRGVRLRSWMDWAVLADWVLNRKPSRRFEESPE